MFLDLKKRFIKLIKKPITNPTNKERNISISGFKSMLYSDKFPPAIAKAIWNRIANNINAAASSNATTGKSVLTNGPFALYCFITINVAAGAVALAIAPRVKTNSQGTRESSMKCATTKANTTKTDAKRASKQVMTKTLLPTVFNTVNLNDVPMEKAIKPKAIVDTHLMLST